MNRTMCVMLMGMALNVCDYFDIIVEWFLIHGTICVYIYVKRSEYELIWIQCQVKC